MIAAIILFLSGCGYDIALNEGDSYNEIYEGDNVTVVEGDSDTDLDTDVGTDDYWQDCGIVTTFAGGDAMSVPTVRFDRGYHMFPRDLRDHITLNGDFATLGGCGMGVVVEDFWFTIYGIEVNNRLATVDELSQVYVDMITPVGAYTAECLNRTGMISCNYFEMEDLILHPLTSGVPFEINVRGLPDMDDYTPMEVDLYFHWTDIGTGNTNAGDGGWPSEDHDSLHLEAYCNTCPYGAQCQYDIEVAGNGDGTGNRVMTSSVDPSIALVSSTVSSGPPGFVDIMQFEVTNNDPDCGPMDLNVVWLEVQASDYGFTGWSDTVSSRLYSHQTSRMIWEGSFENGYFTRVLIGETIPAGETYSYTLTVNTLEATPGDYVNARSMLNGFEFTDSNGVRFWTSYIDGLPFQGPNYTITNP